jgi:DNA-directed RNA polymerase specialized sigma24 family protein
LAEARAAIGALPASLRQVMVLRDVAGRPPDEVSGTLGVSPEEERAMLQQARSLVRARMERHFERAGDMR